jgi:hypothetical protein
LSHPTFIAPWILVSDHINNHHRLIHDNSSSSSSKVLQRRRRCLIIMMIRFILNQPLLPKAVLWSMLPVWSVSCLFALALLLCHEMMCLSLCCC